jgi:hypothetical protein
MPNASVVPPRRTRGRLLDALRLCNVDLKRDELPPFDSWGMTQVYDRLAQAAKT